MDAENSGGSEGELVDDGPCICVAATAPQDQGSMPALPDCMPEICPLATHDDVAATDCALEALRDRSEGLVRFEGFTDAGYFIQRGEWMVFRTWTLGGSEVYVAPAVQAGLKVPEFFENCLADPNEDAHFDCMRNGFGDWETTCDEGWMITEP